MVHVDSTEKRFAAAILSGGKATRYGGAAKGLLEAAPGVSILDRTIREVVSSGITQIAILANDGEPYEPLGLPIVPDLRKGIGPLGGVEAALAHYAGRCDAVLFLPCDLPGITSEQISALLGAYAQGDEQVVFAETAHSFEQPLCAVVHNGLLGAVSKAIDEGKRKIGDVWHELGAATVHFDDPTPFFNVNTPDELARWRARKKGSSMKPKLCVPEEMRERIQAAVETEQIGVEVVSDGDCAVQVIRSEKRSESDLKTLQSGGWIKCEVARSVAKKLNMSTLKTGKLLDLLDVKVRECGLGCF